MILQQNRLAEILGLGWLGNERRVRSNGRAITFFPTLEPVNLIFKGDRPFSYGHYGVHLGQEDRLVFLGPEANTVTGYFIDCRLGSPTLHERLVLEFKPDPSRMLCVPPGVAHTFDTFGVFSLNHYRLHLPDPEKWLSGESAWTIEGDIVNVPMGLRDDDLPIFDANMHPASGLFYEMIRRSQLDSLGDLKHQYPSTEDITFETGEVRRLKFWKRLGRTQQLPEWEPNTDIDGVGWRRHLVVWTGDETGYVPLLSKRPVEVVDRERSSIDNELCLCQRRDEVLTFLGPKDAIIRVMMVDFRRDSKTRGRRNVVEFQPTILRQLVIPRGVGYRVDGADKVFIVNCPELYSVTSETSEEPFVVPTSTITNVTLDGVPYTPDQYSELVTSASGPTIFTPLSSPRREETLL